MTPAARKCNRYLHFADFGTALILANVPSFPTAVSARSLKRTDLTNHRGSARLKFVSRRYGFLLPCRISAIAALPALGVALMVGTGIKPHQKLKSSEFENLRYCNKPSQTTKRPRIPKIGTFHLTKRSAEADQIRNGGAKDNIGIH